MWIYTLLSLVSAVCYIIASRLTFSHLVNHNNKPITYLAYILIPALTLHGLSLAHSIGFGEGQNLSMLNVASSLTWLVSLTLSLGYKQQATRTLLPVSYILTSFSVLARFRLSSKTPAS